MEIKATLQKPYTEAQRMDFIVQYNHTLGYEIRETAEALEAWGETAEEKLQEAKQVKYEEASMKANNYLQGGEALFEFEEGKHIEATDGNIAKLGLSLINFILTQDTESTIPWNTKEDENVELNSAQLSVIVDGLKTVQAIVWTIKFPYYLQLIEEAETVEEVEAIEVDYTQDIPAVEEAGEEE